MYFVVKVTSGQERIVANMLQSKAGKGDQKVYSIMIVEGMRGYIIIEAEDELACREFVSKEHNVRGVLSKPLSQEEIDKLVSMPSKAQDIQKELKEKDFVKTEAYGRTKRVTTTQKFQEYFNVTKGQ